MINRKIHFIGAGGQGILNLIKFFILLNKSQEDVRFTLTGSDLSDKVEFREIKDEISVSVPHDPNLITNDIDMIFHSSVIPTSNSEREKSKELQIDSIEFVDFIRFINDVYMYKKEPELREYSISEEQLKSFWILMENIDTEIIYEIAIESDISPLFKIDQKFARFIAVTGTDGKTTTCKMIYHMLRKLGKKVGLISTVDARIGDKKDEKIFGLGLHVTCPPANQLALFIHEMKKGMCDYIIIEVTSHGIAQQRISGLFFDAIVYTNITNEHLDYHKTWENYAFTKSLLISKHSFEDSTIILNKDDIKSYNFLINAVWHNRKKLLTYGINYSYGETDLVGIIDHQSLKIGKLPLVVRHNNDKNKFNIPLIGIYNSSNLLAACACLISLDFNFKDLKGLIEDFPEVEGRMNKLKTKLPCHIIVDFAHTPNALYQALLTINEFKKKNPKIKIHSIFGCAGLRDAFKRPEMGKIAESLADFVYVTSEDPRTESLYEINNSIISGMSGIVSKYTIDQNVEKIVTSNNKIVYSFFEESINSRINAIKMSMINAKKDDVIIITGKGHEKSMCFGRTEFEWNEKEIINKLITPN